MNRRQKITSLIVRLLICGILIGAGFMAFQMYTLYNSVTNAASNIADDAQSAAEFFAEEPFDPAKTREGCLAAGGTLYTEFYYWTGCGLPDGSHFRVDVRDLPSDPTPQAANQ